MSRAVETMFSKLIWHVALSATRFKWNVLNSTLVLPCLRGARLAETNDRVTWGLFGLTQVPASYVLEVVSGKP